MPEVVERTESLPIPSGSILINSPPIKPKLRWTVYNEPVSIFVGFQRRIRDGYQNPAQVLEVIEILLN